MKISLIVVGFAVAGFSIFKYFAVDNSNLMMASPPSSGLTITGIIGIVTALVGLFMDMQKAIPSELIGKIKEMFKKGKLDIGLLVEIFSGKYGKLDIEQLKNLFNEFKDLLDGDDDNSPNNEPKAKNKDIQIFRQIVMNLSNLKILEDMFSNGNLPKSIKITMVDGQEFSFDIKVPTSK